MQATTGHRIAKSSRLDKDDNAPEETRIASSLDLVSIGSKMLQNSSTQRVVAQAVQVYDRIFDFDGATGCAEIQQKMKLGKSFSRY